MRKRAILCFGWALLFSTSALAETHRSDHFIIYSDLDPHYVQFIQANAEAYYENMAGRYFKRGWRKPLIIYYSRVESDTQKLLKKHGHKDEGCYGRYISSTPAVYTHRAMNNGGLSGWGTLFHEITHHFIELNYRRPPAWFNEGLACFLGEHTRVVKGKLILGRPNPWRERELREKIEKGLRPNIKRLLSTSTRRFYKWSVGYHLARAFFYWLHETGRLEQYLKNVQRKGYGLSVLEETVSESYGRINVELLNFIKKNCYAGAYLKDGQRARDENKKKEAFLKALELKPGYKPAQLELAWCYYNSRDYKKCRENLQQILENPHSIEYSGATRLIANCYYVEQDYTQALKYYQRALEHSDYYEYKYELYYWMARCHHCLKDYVTAKKFYKVFLDNNWEPKRLPRAVMLAEEYLKPDEDFFPGASLKVISIQPPSPAVLNLGEKLNVKFRYHLGSCEASQIWVRPYTYGQLTPDYRAHGSSFYNKKDRKTGIAEGWFYFNKPVVVDEVRIKMKDYATGKRVYTIFHKIDARWEKGDKK